MNKKNTKKTPKNGLGRSLAELLSDNDEQTNMDNKVLMHKDDGSSVKIYNKPDPRRSTVRISHDKFHSAAINSNNFHKNAQNSPQKTNPRLESRSKEPSGRNEIAAQDKTSAETSSAQPPIHNWRMDESRVEIGKSRLERREEEQGIFRHGKPHVIADGEALPITINPNASKREPEQKRIIIGDRATVTEKTTAEGLEQLDRYRPTVKDGFLEELLELSESTPSKSYETDSEGRIIIGSQNKAKVRRR